MVVVVVVVVVMVTTACNSWALAMCKSSRGNHTHTHRQEWSSRFAIGRSRESGIGGSVATGRCGGGGHGRCGQLEIGAPGRQRHFLADQSLFGAVPGPAANRGTVAADSWQGGS